MSASGERLIFEGKLTLLSGLHCGTGLSEDDGDGEISSIAADAGGRPYVPGTSVKGVLRRLAEEDAQADKQLLDDMFGLVKDSNTGRPACLTAFGLTCLSLGSRLQDKKANKAESDYIAARTSIDQASGTAADHKLFRQRTVARGATFSLRLALAGRFDQLGADNPLVLLFVRLLKALANPDGIGFGSGRSDGQGHMKLTATTRCEAFRIADDGTVQRIKLVAELDRLLKDAKPIEPYRRKWTFVLDARDAFAVLGQKPAQQTGPDDSGNVLEALRHDEKTPDLPGTSLSGALRSRAQWFLARARLRDAAAFPNIGDGAHAPSDPVQRLFGETADAIRQARSAKNERSGWAALLRIVALTNKGASAAKKMTSVRLDKITGAPIDGALFSVEAFTSPKFEVSFALDRRSTEQDERFAESFLAFLQDDLLSGITLGHGDGRGFGWFNMSTPGEDRTHG